MFFPCEYYKKSHVDPEMKKLCTNFIFSAVSDRRTKFPRGPEERACLFPILSIQATTQTDVSCRMKRKICLDFIHLVPFVPLYCVNLQPRGTGCETTQRSKIGGIFGACENTIDDIWFESDFRPQSRLGGCSGCASNMKNMSHGEFT